VKYNVGAAQSGFDGGSVANIGLVPLDPGADFLKILGAAGEQIIHDADLAAALRQ
jgi:hypothetical protein